MQAKIDSDRYRVAGRKAISIRLSFLVPSALDAEVDAFSPEIQNERNYGCIP